jgi:hypothetical protein
MPYFARRCALQRPEQNANPRVDEVQLRLLPVSPAQRRTHALDEHSERAPFAQEAGSGKTSG